MTMIYILLHVTTISIHLPSTLNLIYSPRWRKILAWEKRRERKIEEERSHKRKEERKIEEEIPDWSWWFVVETTIDHDRCTMEQTGYWCGPLWWWFQVATKALRWEYIGRPNRRGDSSLLKLFAYVFPSFQKIVFLIIIYIYYVHMY